MKISELIERLELELDKHGDVELCVFDVVYDCYTSNFVLELVEDDFYVVKGDVVKKGDFLVL